MIGKSGGKHNLSDKETSMINFIKYCLKWLSMKWLCRKFPKERKEELKIEYPNPIRKIFMAKKNKENFLNAYDVNYSYKHFDSRYDTLRARNYFRNPSDIFYFDSQTDIF